MSSTEQLFTLTAGDHGPRVYLLHGLFGQGKNWTTVAKALASEFRISMVDLPNHGRSPRTETLSYAELAHWVAGQIETDVERFGDGPVSVVGHSMGGKTAMALALLRPDLVSRLVVADISPVRYPGLREFAGFVAGLRSIDLRSLTDRTSADDQLRAAVPDPTVRSFLLQNLRRGPRPDGDPEARWHWQMNLELLGDHLDELGDWPELRRPPYGGPVLWLAGGRSDYVLPEYAPAMRALFPRAQLVTVKNAGHWVHAEQPDIFVAAVRRFLDPELHPC